MTIPMAKPSTGAAELKLIKEVFKSGWLGEGHITEMFEKSTGRIYRRKACRCR